MKYKLLVSRFEYDNIRYVIGFDCVSDNIKKYYETTFKSSKKLSDNEACLNAYNILKNKIEEELNSIQKSTDSIIGKEFIPYDTDPPEYCI